MPSGEVVEGVELDLARVELRARVRRGRVMTLVVAAVVAVVVGVVALLGGFADQAIRVTDVAPGATLTSGPFAITLDRATVRHRAADDYGPEQWTVTTTGTIANTGDTSLVPNTYDDSFVFAALDLDADGAAPDASELNEPDASESRSTVAPGLAPVPWVVSYVFRTPPGDDILIGVYGQKYATRYILDDELVWQNTEALDKITLPLERLPDQTY